MMRYKAVTKTTNVFCTMANIRLVFKDSLPDEGVFPHQHSKDVERNTN